MSKNRNKPTVHSSAPEQNPNRFLKGYTINEGKYGGFAVWAEGQDSRQPYALSYPTFAGSLRDCLIFIDKQMSSAAPIDTAQDACRKAV